MEYNPAGLAYMQNRDLGFTHIKYVEDTTLQSISFAAPYSADWHKPHKKRSEDAFFIGGHYRSFRSQNEERSTTGIKTGEFDLQDQMFQIGTAYAPTSVFSIGGTGKFITSKIETESASTVAADAGILWRPVDNIQFGASILNIGPGLTYVDEEDPLPLTTRVGASCQLKQLLLLADAATGRDKVTQGAGGIEWTPNKFLALRGGTYFHKTWEVTGGAGIRIKTTSRKSKKGLDLKITKSPQVTLPDIYFGLDYAVQTRHELGLSHNITLKVLY